MKYKIDFLNFTNVIVIAKWPNIFYDVDWWSPMVCLLLDIGASEERRFLVCNTTLTKRGGIRFVSNFPPLCSNVGCMNAINMYKYVIECISTVYTVKMKYIYKYIQTVLFYFGLDLVSLLPVQIGYRDKKFSLSVFIRSQAIFMAFFFETGSGLTVKAEQTSKGTLEFII